MLYRPTQQDYESFRQGLKTGFSPDTSVFSALETFVIIALYKSTFTIPFTFTIPYRAHGVYSYTYSSLGTPAVPV